MSFEEDEDLSVTETDFKITERTDGAFHVLSVQGEIDLSTAPGLLARITTPDADTARKDAHKVVVDLSDVTFLDSTGLGALITADEHLRSRDCELRLVVVAPNVLKVFEITGLTVMFSIFPALSEAIGA